MLLTQSACECEINDKSMSNLFNVGVGPYGVKFHSFKTLYSLIVVIYFIILPLYLM